MYEAFKLCDLKFLFKEQNLISRHLFYYSCYHSKLAGFLRTLGTSPVELGMVCKTPDILSLEELTA